MSDPSIPTSHWNEIRPALARAPADKYPYIRRKLSPVDLLSAEAIEIIEAGAETILEEIGVELRGDPQSLLLWHEAGADVQGERVHIPRGLARDLLMSAPSVFTLFARNPERNVRFGGDATVFSPMGGPQLVSDLDGGRRSATLADLHDFIKLAHVAPAIHFSGARLCEPLEIPRAQRHLDVQYAYFRYSDQGFEAAPQTEDDAADAVALAQTLFGAEYLETHPVLLGNITSNSPLVYDGGILGALRQLASHNQATIVVPAMRAHAAGPVTSAGPMAELLAATLSGMALTQIVRPGAPVIFGSPAGAISTLMGAPTFGISEATQMIFATAQLARRLRVPCRSGGSLCASKVAAAQAGYESAGMLLPALLAGVNLVTQATGWLEGGRVASFEKFVMDADQYALVQSLAQVISERGLAVASIRELAADNPFPDSPHSQAILEEAFYRSAIADYASYEQWSQDGRGTAEQRANRRWKRMLAQYRDPGLDPARDEAMRDFIARRKAILSDGTHGG